MDPGSQQVPASNAGEVQGEDSDSDREPPELVEDSSDDEDYYLKYGARQAGARERHLSEQQRPVGRETLKAAQLLERYEWCSPTRIDEDAHAIIADYESQQNPVLDAARQTAQADRLLVSRWKLVRTVGLWSFTMMVILSAFGRWF